MSSVETGQMSAVETGQMSAVETGQMSAAETGQMSAAETGLMSAVETRQRLANTSPPSTNTSGTGPTAQMHRKIRIQLCLFGVVRVMILKSVKSRLGLRLAR